MIRREIGSMNIAGTRIQVLDWKLEDARVQAFIDTLDHEARVAFTHKPDMEKEIQWFALIPGDMTGKPMGTESVEERIVAYGHMVAAFDEHVYFSCVVHQDYRGVGLGKLMIRLATDLAIRHRKRMVMTRALDSNKKLTDILETEEFEKQEMEAAPGTSVWAKELKWV